MKELLESLLKEDNKSFDSKLDTIRSLTNIQGSNGNWNYNPYMMGIFNGMELVLSILEEREPNYKDKPEKWLEGVKESVNNCNNEVLKKAYAKFT